MSGAPPRAAAIAAVLLASAMAAHAGDWSRDGIGGCRIWNPHPQGNETSHWSGACVGGFAEGRGTVQWSVSNRVIESDEGNWSSGRQSGQGAQVWPTGRYDGELADGEPNGHGVLVSRGARYEGDFRGGKPNGIGTLSQGGDTFRGVWSDGCFHDGARKISFGVPLSECH